MEDDGTIPDTPSVVLTELQEIPMPELTPGSEFLVALLHSAGTASATGMGLTGLSWQEIEAWLKCTDMTGIVTPRDLKTIHTLSRAYANECARATKKDAKPPYVSREELEIEEIREKREVISNKIESFLMSMVAAQPKRHS